MSGPVIVSAANYSRVTQATANNLLTASPRGGRLLGVFVASTTTGTLAFYDGPSASGTVLVNTFTPPAAGWYFMPFNFQTGLFVVTGGTIDATIAWE